MAKIRKLVQTRGEIGNKKVKRIKQGGKKLAFGDLAITVDHPSPGPNTPPLQVSGTFTGVAPYPTLTAFIRVGTNPPATITGTVTVNGNNWTFTPDNNSPPAPLNTPLALVVTNKADATSSTLVPFTLTEPTMTLTSVVTNQPIVTLYGTTNSLTPVTALGGTFVVEQLAGSQTFSVTSHVPDGFANAKLQLQTTDASGNPVNFPGLTFTVILTEPTATTAVTATGIIDVTFSNSMADTAFVPGAYLLQTSDGENVLDKNGKTVTITAVDDSLYPTDALLTLSAPPAAPGTYYLQIGATNPSPVTDQAGNPFTSNPVPVTFT